MSATKNPAQFILASSSPRRRDLLAQIGLLPDQIVPAEIDETPKVRELPVKLASRLARDKAYAVSTKFPGKWVLGADTVVACGRRVLGKPEDRGQAGTFLRLLSGRRHRVIGGICLIQPDRKISIKTVTTAVKFKSLSNLEIDRYLDGDEWNGKAGGYAIQGKACTFVKWIGGSYSNVVGLPLFETAALLRGVGYDW